MTQQYLDKRTKTVYTIVGKPNHLGMVLALGKRPRVDAKPFEISIPVERLRSMERVQN